MIGIALRLLVGVLFFVPFLGHLFVLLIPVIGLLGWLILWIVLLVKPLQGEVFKLPLMGGLAEKLAEPAP